MKNKLQQYFPLIRTKEEILADIKKDFFLKNIFYNWNQEEQTSFLDICSGAKGIKILYDTYFKEIFNLENTPEALEDMLTVLIGKKIHILQVLPNESVRIADEQSLLITDIVAQLSDGTIVNIEVQKIGYLFPGERAACYGADLLLRQYKRVRSERKKNFRYNHIKEVYTIIFFEKSPKDFQDFPDTYYHFFKQTSTTGLKMNLLEKFIFIPLDIFQKNMQNKVIKNKLDAWLTFLSSDEPDQIISLIEEYPEFKPLYQHMYSICQNVEKVMNMFSEELRILDRNTVRYMVDDMQEEINELSARKKELLDELEQQESELQQKNSELQQKKSELQQQKSELQQKDLEIQKLNQIIQSLTANSNS